MGVTVAPHASSSRRLVLTLVCAAVFVLFGVLVLQSFGVGASIFLFALAVVCVIDAVQVQRRRARQASR